MTGWWSQKFAAEGAAAAEGISKQLGKPSADPLTILVRESAQNSWDAGEGGLVRFSMELRRLGDAAGAWTRHLLPGPAREAGLPVVQALNPDSYVLVISDRGTRGLGGPLRADVRARPGETPDFVQFLRNVGEASDQAHGGGTYGFGKGILYSCSSVGAILVDTNALHGGAQPRRLMGAALGPSFYSEDTRFTGRHWWGVEASDGIVDPVGGTSAAEIAAELGLPGFSGDEFGTDIAILGFKLGETPDGPARTPQQAGEFLASSILWNLWPKMGSSVREPHMRFSVTVDGEPVEVPPPTAVPELAPFVSSLDKISTGDATDYVRARAPRIAGSIAATVCLADVRPGGAPPAVVTAARPFDGPAHHFCRTRTPELVVDYAERTPHPDPQLGYGGVFKASLEADRAFAASEPPTHDDWVTSGLSGTDRGVVQGLGRRLQDFVDAEFVKPAVGLKVSVEGLGRLASEMAALIPTTRGAGAGAEVAPTSPNSRPGAANARPGGSRNGGQGARARLLSGPTVEVGPTGPVVIAVVDVPASPGRRRIVAEASAITVAGKAEEAGEGPSSSLLPAIEGWQRSGEALLPGAALEGEDEIQGEWRLVARHVPDAVVRVTVRTEILDA